MKTIAEQAGVSVMTVSRALRNQPGVSHAVKKRICHLSEKLGYRPNPLISTLMTQISARRSPQHLAGMAFLNLIDSTTARVPSALRFEAGARQQATHLGYNIESFSLNDSELNEARLNKILLTRGIRGLIISCSWSTRKRMHLDWPEFSAVCQGYTLRYPNISRVCTHHADNVNTAWRQLRQQGYRRIGMALSTHTNRRVQNLYASSHLFYLHLTSTKNRVPLLLTSSWNESTFLKWYQEHRPQAVMLHPGISSTPDQILNWLEKINVRVPDDLGLVFLDLPLGTEIYTGFCQNYEKLGHTAVDLVDQQLRRNSFGIPATPYVTLIPSQWISGYTIRSQH